MTTISGFDYRNIDIYEEDSFGPPPRFLVEGLNSKRNEDIESLDDDQPIPSAFMKLKAVFSALCW